MLKFTKNYYIKIKCNKSYDLLFYTRNYKNISQINRNPAQI